MTDQPQDNRSLILTAAALLEGALSDARLQPLASAAVKLVLDSNETVAELIMGYKRANDQPTTGTLLPSQVAMQRKTQSNDDNLLRQLRALLEKQ